MTPSEIRLLAPRGPDEPPPAIGADLPDTAHPDATRARDIYRWMLLSRRLEERIVELYRQGRITGGCYTGIGNEATSVGTACALGPSDVLVPTHRDMGSHLVRGHDPLVVMRQYLKRATSQTGGKDSGLHLGLEGTNIVGMISHLSHMMPVAAGVALAERMQGRDSAVLTTVGDGATSLGDFHEALNFAAIQKLPVLFVIVNNQYAYSTPNTMQYANERLCDRAIGYGMVGRRVDGTDVLGVLHESACAVARGLRGEGPTLLESITMRMRGHSEHDDFKYVPDALLRSWSAWDPVLRFAGYLTSRGYANTPWFEELEREVRDVVEVAVRTAEAEPLPEPASAERGVFRSWTAEFSVPDVEEFEAR